MSNIIPFPSTQKTTLNRPSVEMANERIKKFLGVSMWEYLGFECNQDEVNLKINRSIQKNYEFERKLTMRKILGIIEQQLAK